MKLNSRRNSYWQSEASVSHFIIKPLWTALTPVLKLHQKKRKCIMWETDQWWKEEMSSSSVSHLVQIKHQGKQLAAPKEMNGHHSLGTSQDWCFLRTVTGFPLCAGTALHITLPHLHIPCLKKLKAGLLALITDCARQRKKTRLAQPRVKLHEGNACCKQSLVSPIICTLTANIVVSDSKGLTLW